MNSKIIHNVIDQLLNSTHTSWERGKYDDWVEWGRRMMNVIEVSSEVLKTVAEDETVLETKIKELESTIAEKDKLIALLISNGLQFNDTKRALDLE